MGGSAYTSGTATLARRCAAAVATAQIAALRPVQQHNASVAIGRRRVEQPKSAQRVQRERVHHPADASEIARAQRSRPRDDRRPRSPPPLQPRSSSRMNWSWSSLSIAPPAPRRPAAPRQTCFSGFGPVYLACHRGSSARRPVVDFACSCGEVFCIEAMAGGTIEEEARRRCGAAGALLAYHGHRIGECLGSAAPVLPPNARFPCTCGHKISGMALPVSCECGGIVSNDGRRWYAVDRLRDAAERLEAPKRLTWTRCLKHWRCRRTRPSPPTQTPTTLCSTRLLTSRAA